MNIYFIGGIFIGKTKDLINLNSKGVIQNAANAFQLGILEGLDELNDGEVNVCNLPFIGSYPKFFKKYKLPSEHLKIFSNTTVLSHAFFNFIIIKFFSRMYSTFKYISKIKPENNSIVLIYSLHTPFLLGVLLGKKIYNIKSKVIVVVPDLPEYMSDSKSLSYIFLKKIDSYIIYKLIKKIDGFILLTQAMSMKLKLQDNYIVLEGIALNENFHLNAQTAIKKIIFYSGTLARRYGIIDLLDIFKEIDPNHFELWICGDGDGKVDVEKACISNSNIKYLGQLPREKVLQIQRESYVLINPRKPDGEYTKYSFPSKILEYMSSGRPLIMHKLPGISDEYYDHCYHTSNGTKMELKDCLEGVLRKNEIELNMMGKSALNFIIQNKNSKAQCTRLIKFFDNLIN